MDVLIVALWNRFYSCNISLKGIKIQEFNAVPELQNCLRTARAILADREQFLIEMGEIDEKVSEKVLG